MTQGVTSLQRAPWYQRWFVRLWGALAFAPLVFMSREIVGAHFALLDTSNADVLGTGILLIFVMMLMITPLMTLTGRRWFAPLRWWFGIMFWFTAFTDLVIASVVTGSDFEGGFFGRIGGHSFLLVGTTTVLLASALMLTANKRAQRAMGKYWKTFQRLTYVVWFLILLHLLLLFGFGGARFHQALAVSIPLVILRLPWVRRWFVTWRGKRGWRRVLTFIALAPLLALFAYGVEGLVDEEIFKGVQAFTMNPVAD